MIRNASVNYDSFDARRKACVKKDSFFENLQQSSEKSENFQFQEYDKEAEQRYNGVKAFRIPKKTASATPTNNNQNKAILAVRNILEEMEGETNSVAKVTNASQEILPMELALEEENLSMEDEVTEVEIVVME